LGQLPLLSYEYLIDEQPGLTKKENFLLKKKAGEVYVLGGRLFGKSLITEKLDILIDLVQCEPKQVGFSSFDALHIEGVLEDVFFACENHPFFEIFNIRLKRSPYLINANNGYNLIGVNMNISGKRPGHAFYQKHFHKLYIEEASMETDEVFKKRRDSVSELGCIYRASGMSLFDSNSPCGRIFNDRTKQSFIVNLPQLVNPNWSEADKQQALIDFGGESSPSYRIYIKGEVLQDAVGAFDMERVRENYLTGKKTKTFDINKTNYKFFKEIIIVEKPNNAEQTYINADIGESSSTEIIIIFKINNVFRYVYNITLYNLSDIEQKPIFRWLIEKLGANFVSLDCSEGTGRAIYRYLESIYPKENLCYVSFQEKINVDFEYDENDNVVYKKGEPVYKQEYVSDWSVKHLQHLFYTKKLQIPQIDYKFDLQFSAVKVLTSGNRIVYTCIAPKNHLFQAFQCFSIAHWNNEFNLVKPIANQNFFKGVII
jgi:hypothetical protein